MMMAENKLAFAKEFRAAGFHREDTLIALVWCKHLGKSVDDPDCVIIASECRDGLSDRRPREEHEPCHYYRFDGLHITEDGIAPDPLAAIEAASKIGKQSDA